MSAPMTTAIETEQARLDRLYSRLDELRDAAETRLDESRRKHVENEQELSQRDVETHFHRRRIA